MKELGSRLRSLRESIGLSQAKIGKLIGISQVSMNRYESGDGFPPANTLLWYADYFDVPMDYLFVRTGQPQGKLYEFKPKIEDNEDMRLFIEMCFDPGSPLSGKLKETLLQMMTKGAHNSG